MNNQQQKQLLENITANLAFIPISAELYLKIDNWARENNDDKGGPGAVTRIIEHQLQSFLDRMNEEIPLANKGRSFYWPDSLSGRAFELPHNTELRTKYFGKWVTAKIEDGKLIWEGKQYSSVSKLCNAMRGRTNNNAWKLIEIKRPSDTHFSIAEKFRR